MKILNTVDGAKRILTDSDNRFVNDSEKSAIVHSNRSVLDSTNASFTTALKTGYDGAVTDRHTHNNTTALNAVSGTNTGNETTVSIGTLVSGATAKAIPVDADMVPLMDSAASNIIKKLSWVNIKATLKTYFDTLYNNYTHATGFTNQPGTALTGSNVISQITVNTEGHVTATTSRALTAANVGAEPTIATKNTAFNKNYGTTATDVKVDGTQGVGSVDAVARIDHVHPTDTSRASTAIATTGASGLMSSIDKSKLDGVATNATANTGTVTSVAAGNGLNFTTITGSGSVTLGTPGTITNATTNGVTSTSHTHALTLAKADITALGIPAQDTVTSINGKTGVIVKADIVALGVPAQDTVTSINGKTGAIAKEDIVALGIPSSDTNTVTTINGKIGAIAKADIVALGIPAQDTTYSNATTSSSGLMRNTDKSKLDGIDNTIRNATITTTWTGSSAPFTQDITVAGMTSTAVPIISPVYSATLSTALLEKEAWNLISKIETGSGKIIATCFEEKPIIAINIQLKGM